MIPQNIFKQNYVNNFLVYIALNSDILERNFLRNIIFLKELITRWPVVLFPDLSDTYKYRSKPSL